MTIMHWVREKLGLSSMDAADAAMAEMDDATVRVRSVRQQLEPFKLESDPFAAIIRKQIMTDGYESRQMDSIRRGSRQ